MRWHGHARQTAGPCLQSRWSMDPPHSESKRFEAYVKSLWIQNKALSRTLCLGRAAGFLLRCALHAAGDIILQVQDETHHHPFTSFCSLPLQTAVDSVCAVPIWAAATDLPARLERGPRHPGDWVHSHYPLWEKLCVGPGMGEGEREGVECVWGGDEEEQDKKESVCVWAREVWNSEVKWGEATETVEGLLKFFSLYGQNVFRTLSQTWTFWWLVTFQRR